jgi:hypothetical protein
MFEMPISQKEINKPKENNTCVHGIECGIFCEACLNESRNSQPVWEMIDKLMEASQKKGIIRKHIGEFKYELEFKGEIFEIEALTDKNDPRLSEVQSLLEEVFLSEEVDSEEILRGAIDGITPFGTKNEARYKFYVISDSEKKIVSTFGCVQLDISKYDEISTKETVLLVGYAATKEGIRQKGLAKEGYISALIDGAMEAEARGKRLAFAAGDCVYSSEEFWNKIGWKRAYVKISEKEFIEIPFLQPAFEFDQKTGEIAKGAGVTAEHFMIDYFGKKSPSKAQVASSIKVFFRDNSLWPAEAFEGNPDEVKKAQQKNAEHVFELEKKIEDFLANTPKLIYLTAEARERARQAGLIINDWKEADRGEEKGSEDF